MHRVAGVEPIGDHQREAATERSHQVADAEPVQRLEAEPCQHACPANKHGRRVEVDHGRSASEIDAGCEREGVEGEEAHEHPPHEAVEPRLADEEAREAEDGGQHVEPLSDLGGVEGVEPGLEYRLAGDRLHLRHLRDCPPVGRDRRVKLRWLLLDRGEQIGEREDRRVELERRLPFPASRHAAHQRRDHRGVESLPAARRPGVGGVARVARGGRAGRGSRGGTQRRDRGGGIVVVDHPRPLHEPTDLIEDRLAGLVSGAGRPGHFRRVVGEADEVVGHQFLVDLSELLLHEGPLFWRDLPQRLHLLAERRPTAFKFRGGIAMALTAIEVEQVEHLEGVDAKHGGPRHPIAARHHREQPLRCRDCAARFGGGVGWHHHARAVAEQLQHGASDAVEWLDAALVHHRNPAGRLPVEGIGRGSAGGGPR